MIQFVSHTTHVVFCHICIQYGVYNFSYIVWLNDSTKHSVSLNLLSLLLLIVIYYGFDKYNETIIEDWYGDDDDDVTVPILSHNDNYYTFIPGSFVFIADGGDIYMVQFVCDTI